MANFTFIYQATLMHYGIIALRASFIALAGWLVIKYLNRTIKKHIAVLFPDDLRTTLVANIISYLALFVLATIILYEFGINVTALIGAAGVVGVALGFAAQTSVANIISGIFLMIENPFEMGDYIQVSSIEGTIKTMNLFAITLLTANGRVVRISHEQLLKSVIINISKNPNRRYDCTVRFASSQDIQAAVTVIQETAIEIPECLEKPAPFIVTKNISGNYTEIFIGVWTSQKNYPSVNKSFLARLKANLEKAGIKLAVVPCTVEQ